MDSKPEAAAEWEGRMAEASAQFEADHPFGSALVSLDELELNVLVASSAEQKARGMTGRTFEGFDAMLFVFDEPVDAGFHMTGVTVPLVVALYEADGTAIECVELAVGGKMDKRKKPYTYALEAPADSPAAELMRTGVPIVVPQETFQAQLRKAPAEEVNLREAQGGGPENCGNCCYFIPTTACELVESPVSPGQVCDLFALADAPYVPLSLTSP